MIKKFFTPKTITFFWKGFDKDGHQVQGEIKDFNIRLAKAQLLDQHNTITKIVRKKNVFFYKKISYKNITTFIQQLATLLSSNIPLLQSLEIILQTHKHSHFQQLISTIKETIQEGNLLSSAIKQHQKYFDHFTDQLIQTGEQTGKLDIMLERIVLHREKTIYLKNKIKKALFYPCIVIGIAIVITCIFVMFVIPQFADFFSTSNTPLPLTTRIVIDLSHFLKHYFCLIILLALISIYMVILLKKNNQNIALFIDNQILTLPLLGKIFKKSMIAQLAYTLNTIFSAGIPLAEALQSLHFISNNRIFNKTIQNSSQLIEQGYSLHNALQTTNIFPIAFIQMIAIGEETGKLDDILQKVSNLYEMEVVNMIDELIQLLEPTITVILGMIIGSLTIAMYLPIFKLGMMI